MNFRISQSNPLTALVAGGGALACTLRKLSRQINSVAVPLGLAAALMLPQPAPAQAQAESFSFVALGDSRPMMYLPYTKDDADKVHAALVNIFSLILGEKVAVELIKKDSKLTFDPDTGVLT